MYKVIECTFDLINQHLFLKMNYSIMASDLVARNTKSNVFSILVLIAKWSCGAKNRLQITTKQCIKDKVKIR